MKTINVKLFLKNTIKEFRHQLVVKSEAFTQNVVFDFVSERVSVANLKCGRIFSLRSLKGFFFFFCFSLFKAIALKFSVTVVSISIVMFSLCHMSNVGNR